MEKIKEAENYERIDFDNLGLVIFGIELIVHHYHSKHQRREKERRQFIERLRAQPRIILSPGCIVLSNTRE
ncbi:Protein of unknown function [Cotesia congregata]|uniref:Uncharacterized protein n=1 Tax=Cotesia congregata TaxID=51543 RepID=A0A8J2HBJ0_COTCN|nr:Protein of unknown function [Cotesia congregata]